MVLKFVFCLLTLLVLGANAFDLISLDITSDLLAKGTVSKELQLQSSTNERRAYVASFFLEQCNLECFRNRYCKSFTFYENLNVCEISLDNTFDLIDDLRKSNQLEKISKNLNCDLDDCKNGIFCASTALNTSTIKNDKCICDPTGTVGNKCENKIKFTLSEWSEWSPCSTTCDEGFTDRKRTCIMSYTDPTTSQVVERVMENQEWLCGASLKANDIYQVKTCMLSKCSFHTQWSDWSTCNKLCDGFRSRSRNCSLNDYSNENLRKLCTDVYLKNVEVCGFSNCKNLVTSLYLIWFLF